MSDHDHDPDDLIQAVILPYRTPGHRTARQLQTAALVAMATFLLTGILQIVGGGRLDAATLGPVVATLLINTLLLGIRKYFAAYLDEN